MITGKLQRLTTDVGTGVASGSSKISPRAFSSRFAAPWRAFWQDENRTEVYCACISAICVFTGDLSGRRIA